MCGIAGYIGPDATLNGESILRKMVKAIERRGPDGEGVNHWPNAWLGHRRLAIIDLSELGHQPMLSDDRNIGVVFNGCIYNFMDLRSELEALGHSFRSHCDTEVLVKGYVQWGIDGLAPRLRGMFAIGIWDEKRQKLTLIRDRLGVKPLLYVETGGGIGFASTITALKAGGLAGDIDPRAMLEYLEFGYITDARAIYQKVHKLGAGRIFEWQNGKSSERVYWTLPEAEPDSKITFEEAVEETERLLLESVKLRLIADVPVGALLSGGVDSALVCWATRKVGADITAFTVGTPGDPGDETEDTKETARLLDIPHRLISLPADSTGLIDEVTSAYGEPFGAQSAMAMLRVSAAVKPHATVLLTGDGGDDLYLGYWFYPTYLRSQNIARRLPSISGPFWRAGRPLVNAIPQLRRAKHFADYITGGLGGLTRAHDGLPYYERRGLLGGKLQSLQLEQREIPMSIGAARRMLPELLQYQQKTWFVSEFMTKVDGATMHHALEARAPFLDQKMWEFAAKLPPELRLQGGELKAILREIVRRRVSPAVASRKKQGFTIPVERWLSGPWRKALEDVAANSRLEADGWLKSGAFACILSEVRKGIAVPRQVWFLTALENWLRKQA